MIVLDEQLLGEGIKQDIERWYPGKVTDVTQLRPGTVITDDAIPELLRTVRFPTFVTINVRDFWRRAIPDRRFFIVCFAILDSEAEEIPELLRKLFRFGPFRTNQQRMGKIVRAGRKVIRYYSVDSRAVRQTEW